MEIHRRTRRCSRLGDDHYDDRGSGCSADGYRWPQTSSHAQRGTELRRRLKTETGSAVVEFTLISMILIPLVLGLMQIALVLHVRNTMTSAVSEGARIGARENATPALGATAARSLISQTIASRFAQSVSATTGSIGGAPGVIVTADARVPALGLFGPGITINVSGRAIDEVIQ